MEDAMKKEILRLRAACREYEEEQKTSLYEIDRLKSVVKAFQTERDEDPAEKYRTSKRVLVEVYPRLQSEYKEWWERFGAAIWTKYGGRYCPFGATGGLKLSWERWLRFLREAGDTEGFFEHIEWGNLPFDWSFGLRRKDEEV